ncbi:MAG: hypothetical protein U0228_04015 [Myxococcaceae bacterium]
MSAHLHTSFEKAGLPLEVLDRPLFRGQGAGDIVQIDVARARGERFRIFTGASDNRVQVANVDRALRQLVLMVHEPRRRFETFVSNFRRRELTAPPNAVRKVKTGWFVENFTVDRKRHFLAGMDEQHLFIAMLPAPATTVWSAHVLLRPEAVRNAERGAFEKTVRQGEWFFVSLAPRELAEVEAAAKGSLSKVRRDIGIAQAAGIFRGGRPHVADEVLVLQAVSGVGAAANTRVYVRGRVRHPDHATVELRPWRRAIVNTESFEQPQGIGFVD